MMVTESNRSFPDTAFPSRTWGTAALVLLMVAGLCCHEAGHDEPTMGEGAAECEAPESAEEKREFETEDLRGALLYKVLEPDAIPSIDDPQFVPAAEATFMRDDEPVLGVFDGEVAKAYSMWQLDSHEIVNDTLGGTAIAATW
jgi:hypothetical protein